MKYLKTLKIHIRERKCNVKNKEDIMRIDFKIYEKGSTKIEPRIIHKIR